MAMLIDEALVRMKNALEQGRLGHAYIATGASMETLARFAGGFGRMVLETPADNELHAQPDYHEVRPESKSRRILVEQMRNLEDTLRQSPALARRKFAAIFEADRMGQAPANAFLKTLEEPPPDTHILLLSRLPDALLPTILSRCIGIPLRDSGRTPPDARETEARHIALGLIGTTPCPALPDIFLGVRAFQALLAEVREEFARDAKSTLQTEKDKYSEGSDGKWIEEREEQLSALAESEVIRERGRLLQSMADVFAERLRENVAGGDARMARGDSLCLLRQLDALENLRADLNRSMNESLALEAGFLEIFSES